MKTVALTLLVLMLPAAAGAQGFHLRKVVDSTTLVPGGVGTYTHIGPPTIDGSHVGFRGTGSSNATALFRRTIVGSSTQRIVSDGDALGPGTVDLLMHRDPDLSQGAAAFRAQTGSPFPTGGIFSNIGGPIFTVVDTSTPVPNPPQQPANYSFSFDFIGFDTVAISEAQDRIAFVAGARDPNLAVIAYQGVFEYDVALGTIEKRIDSLDVPGSSFAAPRIFGDTLLTYAFGTSEAGIYSVNGSGVVTPIVLQSEFPAGCGFPFFDTAPVPPNLHGVPVAYDGTHVAFILLCTVPTLTVDVFRRPLAGGPDELVFDGAMGSPTSGAGFTLPLSVAMDAGNVFVGTALQTGMNDKGIYASMAGGPLVTVVEAGDTVDGKITNGGPIGFAGFTPRSAAGRRVAFLLSFTDGSFGAYVATVDGDFDGLRDVDEVAIHGTSPDTRDTDGDGLGDAEEVHWTGTDPTDDDSDADGRLDRFEDDDADGVGHYAEIYRRQTDPTSADSDGDGESEPGDNCPRVANAAQTDTDGDGRGDPCDRTDPLSPGGVQRFIEVEVELSAEPQDVGMNFPLVGLPAVYRPLPATDFIAIDGVGWEKFIQESDFAPYLFWPVVSDYVLGLENSLAISSASFLLDSSFPPFFFETAEQFADTTQTPGFFVIPGASGLDEYRHCTSGGGCTLVPSSPFDAVTGRAHAGGRLRYTPDSGPSVDYFAFFGDLRMSEDADTDLDGVSDAADNCPFAANAGQEASLRRPDMGVACKCGDVDGDGLETETENDEREVRAFLAGDLPSVTAPDKCQTGDADTCNLVTAVRLARVARGLGPITRQRCAASLP